MLFLALGVCTSISISALYHIFLFIPFIYYFKEIKIKEWDLSQKALALMIVMVILSVIFNQDIAVKGYEPLTKIKYYIFGLIAIVPIQKWYDSLSDDDRIKKIKILVWTLLIATTFAGLYGIGRLYFNFNPLHIHYSDEHRNTGVVGMVLNFAHDLAFVLIFLTSLLFSKNIKSDFIDKKWIAIFLILNLIVLYTTFARGAWIAYLCAVPVILYYNYKTLFKLFLVTVLLGGLAYNFIPGLKVIRPGSDAERLSQWKTAIYAFKERPILGQGFLNFEKVCPELKLKYNIDQKQFCGHAHNIFLEALASTGGVGLIFMLIWLIAWAYEILKKQSVMTEIIFPLIIVFIMGGMTQATFTLGANLFAIMFFYAASKIIIKD